MRFNQSIPLTGEGRSAPHSISGSTPSNSKLPADTVAVVCLNLVDETTSQVMSYDVTVQKIVRGNVGQFVAYFAFLEPSLGATRFRILARDKKPSLLSLVLLVWRPEKPGKSVIKPDLMSDVRLPYTDGVFSSSECIETPPTGPGFPRARCCYMFPTEIPWRTRMNDERIVGLKA